MPNTVQATNNLPNGEPDAMKVARPVRRERWGKPLVGNSKYGVPVPTLRDPTPSREDIRVTREIRQAGTLLDIDLLDHVIIGAQRFTSMKEQGLGF